MRQRDEKFCLVFHFSSLFVNQKLSLVPGNLKCIIETPLALFSFKIFLFCKQFFVQDLFLFLLGALSTIPFWSLIDATSLLCFFPSLFCWSKILFNTTLSKTVKLCNRKFSRCAEFHSKTTDSRGRNQANNLLCSFNLRQMFGLSSLPWHGQLNCSLSMESWQPWKHKPKITVHENPQTTFKSVSFYLRKKVKLENN